MTAAYVSAAYLLSSILFILSIRGLASPDTARRGNILGMLGMAVAISVTVYSPTVSEYAWMLGAIALGGIIGVWFALKVKMTALPQMIAAFNGLGGLSSVFIAAAEIVSGSQTYLETSLGLLIGAVAFSGSVIAFAKLQGLMSPKAVVFPGQQLLNLVLGLSVVALCVLFIFSGKHELFYILAGLSVLLGFLLVLPIGGRRHACRYLGSECLLRLGGRRHRLLAQQCSADYRRRHCRRQRRNSFLHHDQSHEPFAEQRHARRLRRRNRQNVFRRRTR